MKMKLISKETIQKYTQTVGERNEIDDILTPILLPARIYGLQILEPDWSWKKYRVNRIFSAAITIYVGVGTIHCCSNTTDLNVIIEGIFTMLVVIQMIIKLYLYAQTRDKFQEIYAKAKSFIHDLIKDSPKKRDEVKTNMKYLVNISIFVEVFPVVMYAVLALFSYRGTRMTLSGATSTLMPMTSPYYELGLLIHLHFLVEAAHSLIVIDMWFAMMCYFFLERGEECLQLLKVQRNDDSPEIYAERLDLALRNFYKMHVELMEYLNGLNDMYKWLCLLPLGANLIGTCTFLMIMKQQFNYRVGSLMLPCTGQVFVYNIFGEKVTNMADEINMAFLHFDWTSMALKDQKKYYVIACYLNKKFSVATVVGTDLSLLTLSDIYKVSYQMFTVFSTTSN